MVEYIRLLFNSFKNMLQEFYYDDQRLLVTILIVCAVVLFLVKLFKIPKV